MKRALFAMAALLATAPALAAAPKYSSEFPAEGPWLVAGYDGACVRLKEDFGANTPQEFYERLKKSGEDAKLNVFDANNVAILDNTQRHFPTVYIVRGVAFCQHLADELSHGM